MTLEMIGILGIAEEQIGLARDTCKYNDLLLELWC
jgi:hypothetical protein